MDKRPIGIGLIGLGVVSGQVARILTDNSKLKLLSDAIGCPLVLRKIKVIEDDIFRPLAKELGHNLITIDEDVFFNTPDIDIVVEAIGGENPSFHYHKRALTSGKHVVTSNKEVIAKHGLELKKIAYNNKAGIHYEASVGGGIPIIVPLQQDLVANRVKSIYAIINGTTNYILTCMATDGTDFNEALKKAKELGYAEANPKNDIEGIDATYKLSILSSMAFHTEVKPEDIYCEGISKLTGRDFQYAKELGFTVKLLAIGKQDETTIQARVHPVFIPDNSLLAKVNGVFNAIQIDGDLIGQLIFYGKGAGALPTSSAVISDIIAAAREIICGVVPGDIWKIESGKSIESITELETRYYLRMEIIDKPGVLAQISKVLGDNSISISSVIQKETDDTKRTAEIVIMTHFAKEAAMQQALTNLKILTSVKRISNFVRVEDIK